MKFSFANVRIGRKQATAWCDDLHGRDPLDRKRKPPCVGEFSPEIKPAAEGEHVSQRGVADLQLPRKLKCGPGPREELCAASAGTSG